MRTRLKQAGLPYAEKVFMVSAVKGLGVKDMVQVGASVRRGTSLSKGDPLNHRVASGS